MADLMSVFTTYADGGEGTTMSLYAWKQFGIYFGLLDNNLYNNAENRL